MRFMVKRILRGGKELLGGSRKKQKQGAGKMIPRALAVGLIAVFILGQGTVPCPMTYFLLPPSMNRLHFLLLTLELVPVYKRFSTEIADRG